MSERSPSLLINDILNSGEKILRYTAPLSFEAFITNEIITDAVIRNFEISPLLVCGQALCKAYQQHE